MSILNVAGIVVPILPDGWERGLKADVEGGTAAEREVLETERHERCGKVRSGRLDISFDDYILQYGCHLNAWSFSGIEKGRAQEMNTLERSRDDRDNHYTTHYAAWIK